MKYPVKHIIFSGVIVLLFFSIGINIIQLYNSQKNIFSSRDNEKLYDYEKSFVAPDVNHVRKENLLINFTSLRDDLTDYVSTQSSQIGLYFEYIPTGNSIGINSTTPFIYASLLKIPLVMTIYDKIEKGELSFDEKHPITQEMIDPNFGDLWEEGVGKEISIQEAIEQTLTVSDNTAAEFLRSLLTTEEFTNIFPFLDIPVYLYKDQPGVSPKNYTSVLRSLYYSSFLPEASSEDLLKILSTSAYADGIRSPIPPNIRIAHKMGIRGEYDQLSDCGIIYLPDRPYFLCIMAQEEDQKKAEEIISTLSSKIYAYLTTE